MALGSSISFFSVGLSLVTVLGVGKLMQSFWAWPVGSFLATIVYLSVFALELTVAKRAKQSRGIE